MLPWKNDVSGNDPVATNALLAESYSRLEGWSLRGGPVLGKTWLPAQRHR